jgi:hypothetical protein
MTELPSPPSELRYSGLAVVSLILGVLSPLWFLFGVAWGIFGLVAVFAGRRARKEIDLAPYKLQGRALAIGGIVTGAIGFTTAMFVLIVVATAPPA